MGMRLRILVVINTNTRADMTKKYNSPKAFAASELPHRCAADMEPGVTVAVILSVHIHSSHTHPVALGAIYSCIFQSILIKPSQFVLQFLQCILLPSFLQVPLVLAFFMQYNCQFVVMFLKLQQPYMNPSHSQT
ncbi:hypothetical protein U1Q18_019019 [Sarracenia purpurea var. burkii]